MNPPPNPPTLVNSPTQPKRLAGRGVGMKGGGTGCWFVGAVCPCGYNLLTFDFVRLIVGYVATRDQEEAVAAEEETDCNVGWGGVSFA